MMEVMLPNRGAIKKSKCKAQNISLGKLFPFDFQPGGKMCRPDLN
jgi:hypothetical protein